MFPRLLAKSTRVPDQPRRCETLPGHLADVGGVALALIDEWGERWLVSLGMEPEVWLARLRSACLRGALLHDIGKANDHFQRMVRGSPQRQALRHEVVSGWLLARNPELMAWMFADCEEIVQRAAVCAVVGHHLQVKDIGALDPRPGSGAADLWVLADHADVGGAFQTFGTMVAAGTALPPLARQRIALAAEEPTAEVIAWYQSTQRWFRRDASDVEKRFVAVVKAIVIAADVTGSAIPRRGEEAAAWAVARQRHVCDAASLERVADERVPRGQRRSFQTAVADSDAAVTFVRAGCGSGKTVAAYLWGARRAAGRKLFFCYPTTGTATEGFAGYVPADSAEWELIHSRADADLNEILANGDEAEAAAWAAERAGMLAGWDARVVVCTADTVLGLMQNYRRGLFAFPSIANGAFVFDEVHQYDDRLFGALLRFLTAFPGAPALLMTASLQPTRLEQLRDSLAEAGSALRVVEGPAQLEAIRRYQLRRVEEPDAWCAATDVLAQGGRVLWVANTVGRAVSVAQDADARRFNVELYHSRYRYEDRLLRHRAVIDAFGRETSGVVAVTTQVCEVSLDLSADLLISDVAPIPALVQRMGRLNRRVSEDAPGDAKTAMFLTPLGTLPYEPEELTRAEQWIERLSGGAVSQAELAATLTEIEPGTAVADVHSAWLDGGPDARQGPLREPGATIDVIRSDDAAACRGSRGRVDRAAVTLNTIPMLYAPVRAEASGWQRLGSALVAPAGRIVYSARWGARWA